MTCPNCGQPVEDGRLICPHCGAFLTPTGPRPGQPPPWSPPPAGSGVPGAWPPPERLLTGRRWLDFGLGFLSPPVLTVLCLVGYVRNDFRLAGAAALLFLTALVLCAALSRRCPVVARGLAWGIVAVPLLALLAALGAFAVCLYSVAHPGR